MVAPPCGRCPACSVARPRLRTLLQPTAARPDTQRGLRFHGDGGIYEPQRKQTRPRETTSTRRTRQYPTRDNACPDQVTLAATSIRQCRESSCAIFASWEPHPAI